MDIYQDRCYAISTASNILQTLCEKMSCPVGAAAGRIKLKPIQGCLLEVVREQYTDFYRDKERWRYLQKLDTKNRLLSLDGFTDSEGYSEAAIKAALTALIRLANTVQLTDFKIIID